MNNRSNDNEKLRYGAQYKANIEGYNSEGDGVARINGQVVFVPGTANGDECLVKIVNTRSKFAWGELLKVISPSPDRIQPDCPVFPACGGCALRHISYEAELSYKAQKVIDVFTRIGGLNVELEGITPSPETERYRNKALYPVRSIKGKTCAGFYRRASHDIVPCTDCRLESEVSLKILKTVLAYMEKYNIRAYSEKTGTGIVRHVYVRSLSDGAALACIVSAKPHLPMQDALVGMLTSALPQLRGILLNINQRRDNVIMSGKSTLVWGEEYLRQPRLGKTFTLSADSFFQINSAQTENLYA